MTKRKHGDDESGCGKVLENKNKGKFGRTLGSSSDPVSPHSSLVLHPSCENSVWWVPV